MRDRFGSRSPKTHHSRCIHRSRKLLWQLSAQSDRVLGGSTPGRASCEPTATGCRGLEILTHGRSPGIDNHWVKEDLTAYLTAYPGAVCDTPGRLVAQTRQAAEYIRHVLARPDASWRAIYIRDCPTSMRCPSGSRM